MTFRASFKPRLIALATACALTIGTVQPAHALFGIGDIVLDPSNLVQNTMTAARTLEQINNQIRQLQNEAQMLINQARNLASLPFNVVNRLRSTLDTTRQLIAQAQGLAYQVSNLDAEFARLEPELPDVVLPPTTMPWGNRSALFRDPDGNLVNLFSRPA